MPPQTCCGQPAYNSGDRETARDIALQNIQAFANCDYIVAPSGSCGGMLAKHYAELFAGDPNMAGRASQFASRCHELISFLVDVRGVKRVEARFDKTVTYHDSCSGLRELGVRAQPRALLQSVAGLRLTELKDSDVCCGFGGTFAVKYGEISNQIVSEKCACIDAGNADVVLAGDLGCLFNIAGKLSRQGSHVEVRHIAEVLAGMTEAPSIAAPKANPK